MLSQSGTKPSAISEGKKRALEALERRFALAKPELCQEGLCKDKKRKRSLKGDGVHEGLRGELGASLASPPERNPFSSSKKGHVVFSGSTPRVADVHPVYSELSQIVHENLVGASSKVSSGGDAVNKIVTNLLQNGDNGHKYIKGSISMKIDNWFLLDNFVPKVGSSVDGRVKALQSHSKRSKEHMSMRQHRTCGSYDLPKQFHSFNLFKPMHEMWKEYVTELMNETRRKQLAQCLLTADLHGAVLQVVECKTSGLKGVTGIMIRETAETFGIITQENRFRVVPKFGSVFIFQAGCWKITLFGDKLSLRNNAS